MLWPAFVPSLALSTFLLGNLQANYLPSLIYHYFIYKVDIILLHKFEGVSTIILGKAPNSVPGPC